MQEALEPIAYSLAIAMLAQYVIWFALGRYGKCPSCGSLSKPRQKSCAKCGHKFLP